MVSDEITDRLIQTLRMLRDQNEIHAEMAMHVQLLNILSRLHAHRNRRPNALHFIDHDQIIWLTMLPPLSDPLLVNQYVIDC
ncbi:hypothetical protein WK30_14790 [Burkholderia vietnamiensis]|nr:hypothetical protein WJ57_13230 [Burkholderia vietnamiensis]KVS02473.1 hypothetical protein WK30_14790 [Burkholderia vietnamiensis]